MSARKRKIPPINTGDKFIEAIKENLETITGQRGVPLELVDTTGMTGNDLTLARAINAIIYRLQ